MKRDYQNLSSIYYLEGFQCRWVIPDLMREAGRHYGSFGLRNYIITQILKAQFPTVKKFFLG